MRIADAEKRNEAILWANRVASLLEKSNAPEVAKAVRDEIEEFDNRKLSLAIIGLMKRGKSTFCNAWLRRSDDLLAPVDFLPATGIISKFRYDAVRENCDVLFEDGKSIAIPYSEIKNYATESGNPQNKKKVKNLTVYGRFDLDPEVELIDMPGDDSIHAYHTEIVYDYLPKADLVVFLSSADNPITRGELSLLKKVKDNDLKKVFFVINKMDKCDNERLQDAEKQDQETLSNAGITIENEIYRISAKKAMEGEWDTSGIDVLADALKNYLSQNKETLLYQSFYGRILAISGSTIRGIRQTIQFQSMKKEELEARIQELERDYEAAKEKTDGILEEFSDRWEQMLKEFDAALPAAEKQVQAHMAAVVQECPALSIGKKVIQKLPETMMDSIEKELDGPCRIFKEQAEESLRKLNQDFPDATHFLAEDPTELKTSGKIATHAGSYLFGGILLASSWGLTQVTATAATVGAGSWWTAWIGTALGGTTAITLGPLAMVLGIGGGIAAILPAVGWVLSKNRQKKELLQDVQKSVRHTFQTIKMQRIPYLRQQKNLLMDSLKKSFEEEIKHTGDRLRKAMAEKNTLQGQSTLLLENQDLLDSYQDLEQEVKALCE